MLTRILIVLLMVVATAAGAGGGESDPGVAQVTVPRSAQHIIESVKVGDTFVIQIRLPASYPTGEKKYPVLYVLDADKCFGLASDTAHWLAWAQEAPEIIVVGIAYGEGRDWWQKRSRDLTPTQDASKLWGEWPIAGGAVAFQDFLAEELFPYVEGQYRAMPDDRAVAGISFGGLFGAFSLFSRPALFQRYILIAPAFAWDNRRLWKYEAEYREKSKSLPVKVFTAVGDKDEPAILEPWLEFNNLVQGRQYAGLSWISHEFPDEGHVSVLPGALARGLRVVY